MIHMGRTINVGAQYSDVIRERNCLFSIKYADRVDLFEGMNVWECAQYRKMQGTYPVIFLTFADVKEHDFKGSRAHMCSEVASAWKIHAQDLGIDSAAFESDNPPYGICRGMSDETAAVGR